MKLKTYEGFNLFLLPESYFSTIKTEVLSNHNLPNNGNTLFYDEILNRYFEVLYEGKNDVFQVVKLIEYFDVDNFLDALNRIKTTRYVTT